LPVPLIGMVCTAADQRARAPLAARDVAGLLRPLDEGGGPAMGQS
jgi:hypothetical protein